MVRDVELCADKYHYRPTHALLRDKVRCTLPSRNPTPESLQELRVLALCTRSHISRDLLRVIARFVIRQPSPRDLVSLEFITTTNRRVPILAPRNTEIRELARLLHQKNFHFGNLVHISSKTLVPRLMYLCRPMGEMVSGLLTLQQRRWLFVRTLEEAGIEDRDVIDSRYQRSDSPLLLGQTLPLPAGRADENVLVLQPNYQLISKVYLYSPE